MNIAYKMKQIRQAAGISQKALGETLDTGTRTISDYETGKSTPGIDYIKRFCEYFNISIDELTETRKKENTMAKKKFEEMNTSKVFDNLETATDATTQPAKTIKPEANWKRVNLPIEPENHDFIKKLGQASGRNLTQIINTIIKAYRTEHPELMEKVDGLLDFLDEGF